MDLAMETEKNNVNTKKRKSGRPKGSKRRLNIPTKNVGGAVGLIKLAYKGSKGKSVSTKDLQNFMDLKTGALSPIIGVLMNDYGFLEKDDLGGYLISTLGLNAIKGDKTAIREAFERNNLMRELSRKFFDKEVTQGLIEDFLKKKYKMGADVVKVTQRFLEGCNYIKGLSTSISDDKSMISSNIEYSIQKSEQQVNIQDVIKLIKLKYAINPPKENEISNLAESLNKAFTNIKDEAIRTLIKKIRENKEKKEILNVLVDSVISIIFDKEDLLLVEETLRKDDKKDQDH